MQKCGQEPLQIYWFCAAAKFFNIYYGSSGLLRKIVHADFARSASNKKCWTAEFIEACEGLRSSDRHTNCVKAAISLPIKDFHRDEVVNLRERLRTEGVCLFVCYMTRVDTAMSLRQGR